MYCACHAARHKSCRRCFRWRSRACARCYAGASQLHKAIVVGLHMLSKCAHAGRVLVRFYGERTLMWLREEDVQLGPPGAHYAAELHAWGRANRKWAEPPPPPVRPADTPMTAACLHASPPAAVGRSTSGAQSMDRAMHGGEPRTEPV